VTPRNAERLTTRMVQKARPKAQEYHLWDSVVPGLSCKVLPSGRKVWMFYYRGEDGKQRRPKLGTFGPLTVKGARVMARQMYRETRYQNTKAKLEGDLWRELATLLRDMPCILFAKHTAEGVFLVEMLPQDQPLARPMSSKSTSLKRALREASSRALKALEHREP
jgi:hypothetical protein